MRSKLMAALLISEALHLMLLGLLADVTIAPREVVLDVADIGEVYGLINEEIGNDPDLPLNYNLPRIEDIDIPGPIQPEETAQPLHAGRPLTR